MKYILTEENERWLEYNAIKNTVWQIAAQIGLNEKVVAGILKERGLKAKSARRKSEKELDATYDEKMQENHKHNKRILMLIEKCKTGSLGAYKVIKMYPYCVLLIDKRGHKWCYSYGDLARGEIG